MKMLKIVVALIGLLAARSHAITVNPANAVTGDSDATPFTLAYRDASGSFASGPVVNSSVTVTNYLSVAGSSLTIGSNGILNIPSQPYMRATVGVCNLTTGVSSKFFFGTPSAANNVQNIFKTATTSGTFTVPAGAPGGYSIDFHLFLGHEGVSIVDIKINGAVSAGCYHMKVAANNGGMQCNTKLDLAANDTIEIFMTQSSGADVVPNTNAAYSYLTITKLN